MAMEIVKDGEHFLDLKDKYCFFNGVLLRTQVTLAIMEAVGEDSDNIELFWTLFNELLQKVSGKKDYKFNPIGFCTNMAGVNFSAITKLFGDEMKSAVKSCEFRLKEQRNKRACRMQDDESCSEFKECCERLLTSTTEQAYDNAKKDMDTFIVTHLCVWFWMWNLKSTKE
ncbi:Hypothetical predicted protein, partial [Paramuricea clavata]